MAFRKPQGLPQLPKLPRKPAVIGVHHSAVPLAFLRREILFQAVDFKGGIMRRLFHCRVIQVAHNPYGHLFACRQVYDLHRPVVIGISEKEYFEGR